MKYLAQTLSFAFIVIYIYYISNTWMENVVPMAGMIGAVAVLLVIYLNEMAGKRVKYAWYNYTLGYILPMAMVSKNVVLIVYGLSSFAG